MAQQLDVEGTSGNGEANEFERFLTGFGVSKETIRALTRHGINAMYIYTFKSETIYNII